MKFSIIIPGIAIKREDLALTLPLQPLPLPAKPLILHHPSHTTTHPPLLHPIIAVDVPGTTIDPPPVCAPPTCTAIVVITALPHQHPRPPSVTRIPHFTTTTTTDIPTDIPTTTHTITTAPALARIHHLTTIEVILRDTAFAAPLRRQVSHIAIPNIRAQGRQDPRNHHPSAWLRGVRTHRTPTPIVVAGRIRTTPSTVLTRAK